MQGVIMNYLIILLGYFITVPLFNYFLYCIFSWRKKLPIADKFKGKKSPIYKLVQYRFDNYHQIEKWELRYRNTDEEWFAYFIPFMSLTLIYKYNLVDSLGVFTEMDFGKMRSLKTEYEAIAALKKKEKEEKLTLKEKRQLKIDALNSEFKHHYVR